ncbi:MAG: cytochrome ubiquinol oxidase subunit I [Chloroflexi bacterium]|nr:cytochrome ubiquinol oxidase subunit I [Chloroflexota bacterium]MCI0580705.1 cytochrome ubiquinol oxidase subunit I [Chloroflexota bacterium]MCI0648564.1 cytochrome ubiquinol oxidase subunit I [Chloroflexota bacterium]MCI0727327.1 cytochrome ubiquinol oxidase subunit I [Chloroflexota bacterium]
MQAQNHPQAGLSTSWRTVLSGVVLALCLLALFTGVVFAQDGGPAEYRQVSFISSRVAIWLTAQVHLMFGAFMLGVPMFALVVEYVGLRSGDKRYDDLAREFTKLILVAASTTAGFGALLTFLLFTLYPNYMGKLADAFLPTMIIYPLLIFGEIFFLYLYWYSWDRLNTPTGKRWHLLIGLLLNVFGTVLMFVANAWLTFAISPESEGQSLYDSAGNFTGTVWQAVNNATWWPINIHRVIANVAFGGAVVGMYAALRFLDARNDEERAHYDWMGYVGNFIAVIGLIPLPFAGYWLGREIYGFNQQMGVTMMGGFLSWLWILQAMLIAVIFLSANYYLWIGMGRIEGGERYTGVIKWLLLVLTIGVLVWATPHNPVVTPAEQALIGGAFHPLLGVLGVMSAKNTAVNIMILSTFLSFLLYRRAGKGEPLPFASHARTAAAVLVVVVLVCLVLMLTPALYVLREGLGETSQLLRVLLSALHGLMIFIGAALTIKGRGKLGQWLIMGSAAFVVVFFGVYGYFVEAVIRIGFSIYQVLAVLTTLISVSAIDILLYRGAPNIGAIRWGQMPLRSQYILILLAVTFTWLMGLMGYARNAIRQHWHIYQVVQDTSVDAFSPTLGFAAQVISVCVLLFLGLVGFIFWLSNLGQKKEVVETAPTPAPVIPKPEPAITD